MHHVHPRAAIDLLSPFKLTLLKANGLAIRGHKAKQQLCMKGLERFFGLIEAFRITSLTEG